MVAPKGEVLKILPDNYDSPLLSHYGVEKYYKNPAAVFLVHSAKRCNQTYKNLYRMSDARTSLGTEQKANLTNICSIKNSDAYFIYHGIRRYLNIYSGNKFVFNELFGNNKTVTLLFNVDGIPLFKSSVQHL